MSHLISARTFREWQEWNYPADPSVEVVRRVRLLALVSRHFRIAELNRIEKLIFTQDRSVPTIF